MVAKGGMKRAAAAPAPAAKKVKLDPYVRGIRDTISTFADDLPEATREMLCAAAVGSFSVPADLRHECQRVAVTMVGEVIQKAHAKLQRGVDECAAVLATHEASKGPAEQDVTTRKEGVAAAETEFAQQESACQVAKTERVGAAGRLTEAKQAQRAGDRELESAEQERSVCAEAIETDLKPLLAGELSPAEATKHYKALLPLVKKCTLDESLLIALPSACKKMTAERSSFDNVVMEEVGKCLNGRASEFTAVLEAGEGARAERAATVEAAQRALEAAGAVEATATSSLSASGAHRKEAENALRAAEAAVAAFEPQLAEATSLLEKARDALNDFTTWNLECYKVLKDKASPPSVLEEAPAAGAEAAGGETTVAPAEGA